MITAAPLTKERQTWMDLSRGAAVLAVIIYHGVTLPARYGYVAPGVFANLNEALSLFRMPLLVFLSGMLLARSLSKPTDEYLTGKVHALLWPYLVWTAILYAIVEAGSPDWASVGKYLIGGTYLWYIGFLFVYFLIALPLKRVHPLVIALVAFAVSLAAPDGSKYIERFFYLMAFFFLGHCVSRYKSLWLTVLSSKWVWMTAPVVAAFGLYSAAFDVRYGPLYAAAPLAGALFFSALATRAARSRMAKPLIWVGENSIAFYVIHVPIMFCVAIASQRLGAPSYLIVGASSVFLGLLGGAALAYARHRWPLAQALLVAPFGTKKTGSLPSKSLVATP